jgi:hypothetical protein
VTNPYPRPRKYDGLILGRIGNFGAITIRQAGHAFAMTRTTSYYVCRKLRDEGRIAWSLLNPELGNASQVVMHAIYSPTPWTECHLALADVPIHYKSSGWSWITTRPYPVIERDGVRIQVVPATQHDDLEGESVLARLAALGARRAVYSDPDTARAAIVRQRAEDELKVRLLIPPSFRLRQHYIHDAGLSRGRAA